MIRIIGIATALVLVTTAANADKPTFGEKLAMPYRAAHSVKGTKPQRGNTERELMDQMGVMHRNSPKGHGLGLDHTLTNKQR
jgi:hypothetical protein